MRRQRRYKACDPFAKNTKKVKEPIFDLAPKKKGEDDDHFKESKRFLRFQQGCERAMAAGKRGQHQHLDTSSVTMEYPNTQTKQQIKAKKKKEKKEEEKKAGLERGANETKKEYFRRLDAQVNDAINTTMMDSRTLRKKRKLHLKARDEKKKKKKIKNDDNQIETTSTTQETHKFGEYVEAPPDITAKPRNANKTDDTNTTTATKMTKEKLKGLQLMSILEGTKKNKEEVTSSTIKTKELSKEALEKERQRAIDAYRLMKKQTPR